MNEIFQKVMKKRFKNNWEGLLNFEKVKNYLLHFKNAI